MTYAGKDTLYDYLKSETIEDGIHTLVLGNGEQIDFEIVNFSGDTTITSDTVIGNDTEDTQMLILKVDGNLTIETDAILTPQVRKKGFTIFTTGNLINNGTISMTARGASAEGQELLIYGFGGTYDVIPAVGALGGEAVTGTGSKSGNVGATGTNRALGGGGSGACYSNKATSASGAGGSATSYSGGAGGGGCASYDSVQVASDGSSTGGAGGNAASRRTSSNAWNASGGAGNPGGKNSYRWQTSAGVGALVDSTSESGTGGLLIIYCDVFSNYGLIESKGSNSGQATTLPDTRGLSGGASGGGSINVFANVFNYVGNTDVSGGIGASCLSTLQGGNGGDGCVTFTVTLVGAGTKYIDQTAFSYTLRKVAKVVKEELSALESGFAGLSFSVSGTDLVITDGTNTWTIKADS